MSKLDENGQVIYRADGKVLKSDRWSPPDLRAILADEKAAHAETSTNDERRMTNDE